MSSCFLLPANLLEHSHFRQATVRERLYLVWALSEFGLRGPFYRSDLEVAVTLGMSLSKVRQARRLFAGMGWITIRPGFQSGGRNLATRYLTVTLGWASDADHALPVHRFAFDVLLHEVRQGELRHADVLVYLYLDYLRRLQGADDECSVEIIKNRLRKLSGLPGFLGSVRRLYRDFRFEEGSHLFAYEDHPDRLILGNWMEFADPAECGESAEEAEAMRAGVKRQVQMRRGERLCIEAPRVAQDPVSET